VKPIRFRRKGFVARYRVPVSSFRRSACWSSSRNRFTTAGKGADSPRSYRENALWPPPVSSAALAWLRPSFLRIRRISDRCAARAAAPVCCPPRRSASRFAGRIRSPRKNREQVQVSFSRRCFFRSASSSASGRRNVVCSNFVITIVFVLVPAGSHEINQAVFGGQIEQASCAGDGKAFSSGHAITIPFVDRQQVGAKKLRQCDSSRFSFIV